jgi:hypothetical protein
MRSSQNTAIKVLDRYDMYAGDKSDASVGSGRLVRLFFHMDFASPYRLETRLK